MNICRFFVCLFLLLPFSQVDKDKDLQWNRYITNNFEILSIDNNQGKYLSENIEFIRTWISWRWGMKDFDFPTLKNAKGEFVKIRCKLICVPNNDLFQRLFNRKMPTWRIDVKDGLPEYTIWYVADEEKWHTKMPLILTELILSNFEASTGSKLPVWCHRGQSILNSRMADIREKLTFQGAIDSKQFLNTSLDDYNKLTDAQRLTFDSQSTCFCLWLRQEYGGMAFLQFLSGSTTPESRLQQLGIQTYSDCDIKLKEYITKAVASPDYLLSW